MVRINRSLAIVIGIDQYTNIPKLKNAVSDASKLANVLKNNYNYEVLLLLNQRATKEKFDELLANLENKTIQFDSQSIQIEPSDHVLFYFAGHGFAEEAQDSEDGKPAGYFMPQDADNDNSKTWLSMQKLYEAFTSLDCHHLLMILDCCFAGRISWVGKGRNAARSRKLYQQSYDHFIKHQTQQIITSAAHDEKARDSFRFGQRGDINGHSPFAHLLLKILQGNSDGGKDKFIEAILEDKVITAHELFTYLQNQLGKIAGGQTPALSQPRKYNQQTGEYIFFKGEYIFPLPNFNRKDLISLELGKDTNPYKGLASFEKEDSQLFFGRKRLIEEPKEGLFTKVNSHPLTVVLGTSGSGKSSLVKAGLISALKLAEESGKQKWVILAPMRPGESPLNALNKILTKSGSASSTILSLSNQEKNQVICNKIDDLISPGSKLLVVIDQAEELFTLCQNAEERKDFINLLARLLNNYQQQLRIVLTLRSEFEPQIRDAIKENHWQKAWQDGRFIVTPMNREELQQAIEEPAAQRALFFESPQLVNNLIDEVVQMPGALPLLSFTLSELYLKYLKAEEKLERNDRTITKADYLAIGGVARSLTQTADKTYEKLVKEKVDESTIRDVMLRMVAISGGELARRQVPTSELVYPEPKNEQTKKVIKCFEEARLLVKGLDTEVQEYVEPVHDALIIGWAKIKYWLDEKEDIVKQVNRWNRIKNLLTESLGKVPLPITSKENSGKSDRPEAEKQLKVNLPLQREVNTSANNWLNKKNTEGNKKAVGFLWDGDPRLPQLEQIQQSNNNWFNKSETAFVQHSINLREKNRRIRMGLIATALSIVSVFYFVQWKQNQEAQSINLVASSKTRFASDQQLDALVEVIKSGKTLKRVIGADTEATRKVVVALLETLYKVKERNRLQGHQPVVSEFSFSSDGNTLISKSEDGAIQYLSLEGKKISVSNENNSFRLERCSSIEGSSNSPNGKIQVTWDYDGFIRLLYLNNQEQWEERWKVQAHRGGNDGVIYCVHFSPDGQMFASVSSDKTIKLWSVEGKQIKKFKAHKSKINSVRFSPDGKSLASAGDEKIIKIWSLEGKELKAFQGDSESVLNISFSPDGKVLASANGEDYRTITVWSLEGKEPKTLDGKNGANDVIFSPDGKMLASASNDGSIKFWSLDGHSTKRPIPAHENLVNSISFSPDGKMLVSTGKDGAIKLWNLNKSGEPLEKVIESTKEGPSLFQKVSFSPDGKMVAVNNSRDGKIRLLSIIDGKELRSFEGNTVSFSPDGKMLAFGSKEGNIKLWTVEGEELATFKGHTSDVSSLSFSPDGKTLASASNDGTISLWNLDLEQLLAQVCNWARDYLQNNPNVNESDRKLCDGISYQ
jgi:WD40 repeat protein